MVDFVMRRWELEPVPYPQAPLHIHHGGDEGFVVLQGELDVTLGDTVQRLTAGEFVIVRAGTVHTFATVGDTPASILVTMTPEIDALIRELYQVPTEQRDAVWGRFNSAMA